VYPEEDIGKCQKLTIASHSNGIGFTFRSSLFFRRWALSPRPIFFIPSLFIDISSIIGPVQQAPGAMSILIEPIFLGHIFGPSCCSMGARDQLIRDPSSEEPGAFETGFMEIHFGPAANLTTILP